MTDGTVQAAAPSWSFGPGRALAWLLRQLQAEQERWALWLPVGIGTGVATYFALLAEPPPWLGPVATLVLMVAVWLAGRRGWMRGRLLAIGALSLTLGFAAAQIETWRAAAPVLPGRLGPVAFAGHVVNLEILTNGQRVTIAPQSIGDLTSEQLPRFIRLRIGRMDVPPEAGDLVEGTAMLLPPAAPDMPEGYDFQRQAYFQGLGAVGAAVGPIVVWPAARGRGIQGFIARWRAAMTERIQKALPGTEGGVASALVTGEKGAIPPDVAQDFRDAGLAHLLVIAGLHMTLVTGCAFFLLRGGLALVPRVALRYPIKKWAASTALALACLYLIISGSAVPTQRAFTMCALALLAILYDRIPFSLNAVCWAASLVLLVQPVALTGGSFQMSFSAVICLIAFYESYGRRFGTALEPGPWSGFWRHIIGIAITTVVVTIGTAPFAIYHFSRFPVYSVLGNVLAVPVSAFWIMPWALVGCLLMPFGLEGLGLTPMGWGIVLVEHIAHWTAHLPGGVAVLPAMPGWAIAAVALGGLWWALWLRSWRWWGLLLVLAGMASLLLVRPPDILISDDGRLAAIHSGHRYWFTSMRGNRFAREIWMEADGAPKPQALPQQGRAELRDGALLCADGICRGRIAGQEIVVITHTPTQPRSCPTEADLIIVTLRRMPCEMAGALFDPARAAVSGAQAIWLDNVPTIAAARALRGRRPWVGAPETFNPETFNNGG
ncbi:MAG TPA: ComEC/Rec2 family competence protein [Stellaceae bacterium]|nr:ComEC/Rec2 family competence protein [Stellaceae bacterium]